MEKSTREHGKNATGIIALRINRASITENATEKITLCWIKSRQRLRKILASAEKIRRSNAF